MVEQDKTTQDTQNPDGGQNKHRPFGYMQWVWVAGAWAFIGLLLIALFWPNLSERTKFFTGNLWNLVIAFAIIAQVLVYQKQRVIMRKQWEAMQEQLKVMRDQARIMGESLTETRRIFDLTERPLLVATAARIDNLAQNQPLRPIVTFANKGRTTAHNFEVSIEIAAQAKTYWIFFPKTFPNGHWFIGANDTLTIQASQAAARTIDDDLFRDAVIKGSEQLMVHGEGRYQDLAGRKYSFEYAFQFRPESGFIPYPITKWEESEEDEEDETHESPNPN